MSNNCVRFLQTFRMEYSFYRCCCETYIYPPSSVSTPNQSKPRAFSLSLKLTFFKVHPVTFPPTSSTRHSPLFRLNISVLFVCLRCLSDCLLVCPSVYLSSASLFSLLTYCSK